MNSDTFHADAPADPAAGTAVIHPVTPEMMDEAAHKAAQLADDVAHHVVPAPGPASEAPAAPAQDAAAGTEHAGPADTESLAPEEAAPEPVAQLGEAAAEIRSTAESALVATAETVDDAVRDAADRVEETLVRTAKTADTRASDGAEVLGQYNAALLGMVQANLTATGEHVAALARAQSLPEAVAINTDHMRRRFDALTAQGRDLAALTQKLAFAAFGPLAAAARDTTRRDA